MVRYLRLEAYLALLSIGFFIPVLVAYARTGLVVQFPTLIVCGFVMVAAIQSFFARLILKTIYQKNRQDFEMELYRVTGEQKRLEGMDCEYK